MRTVYKYPIARKATKFSHLLPANFKFIRVGFQADELFMWAEVDTTAAKTECKFQLFGTGHDIPAAARWLATYDDGPFVLHLYQLFP